MNREEIQKLLGGYATGTLTTEEQQALFAAALEDQELFDALGREQALRDLLRDPAAKAHLLAALDAPAGGFWRWLRRPLVASLCAAGVAGIAIVGVWQATRNARPAPVIVAELKVEQPKGTVQVPPEVKPREELRIAPQKQKEKVPLVRGGARADQALAQPQQDAVEKSLKDIAPAVNAPVAAAAPVPPPPPPPASATATPVGSATQTVEVTATAAALAGQLSERQAVAESVMLDQAKTQAASGKLSGDARSLFYANGFVRNDNAGVGVMAGSGGAQLTAPQASSTSVRVADGTVAKKKEEGRPSNLGVRVSVLRGVEEAAVTTVLNPGESVRLRLTPNADGFLYVAVGEGTEWKMVASGPAQRMKPFETPPLSLTGSGPKQVYVMLSRIAQTLSPKSLAGLARTNLVETLAEKDRATYVVANLRNGMPQQVVQAITLTYR
ncbi:MAG: hypothetical protein JWP63_3301 [Candidatus Solibacter sp.]|jgi:hypothetical protein|nr:hypothetical protein [Candidatus Solibacter sp.]